MSSADDLRRLFFAYQVHAHWPQSLPAAGHILRPSDRHLTVAFLGQCNYTHLERLLASLPLPALKIAPSVYCSSFLPLPSHRPRVASWKIDWLEREDVLEAHAIELENFLVQNKLYTKPHRAWLPHCTLARRPRQLSAWEEKFRPRPALLTGFYLYETVGQTRYKAIWGETLQPPFELIDEEKLHFHVHAETMEDLLLRCKLALSFHQNHALLRSETSAAPSALPEIERRLRQDFDLPSLRLSEGACATTWSLCGIP